MDGYFTISLYSVILSGTYTPDILVNYYFSIVADFNLVVLV